MENLIFLGENDEKRTRREGSRENDVEFARVTIEMDTRE